MRYLAKRIKYKILKELGLWKSYHSEWITSLEVGHSSISDQQPWISFAARDYLDEHVLKPHFKVFEYGTGGSTLFYANRVAEVIGVEHDEAWFELVQNEIKQHHYDNCTVILQTPSSTPSSNNSNYGSQFPGYEGSSFEAYVQTIDDYPHSFFDLVVIDGRSRVACLRHAINKVKDGGYILFDNTERPRYGDAIEQLKTWVKVHESDGYVPYIRPHNKTKTTIWKKPKTIIDKIITLKSRLL